VPLKKDLLSTNISLIKRGVEGKKVGDKILLTFREALTFSFPNLSNWSKNID